MASSSTIQTLLIGIGNEFRRDDAAGVELARRIRRRGLRGVIVQEASGEGASLMELWAGAERVIIVDAVQADRTPGACYRIDAREQEVPASFFQYSTHAFSVAEAIELARSLDTLPPRIVVYGIEGKDFSMGRGLSPELEAALEDIEARIVNELAQQK